MKYLFIQNIITPYRTYLFNKIKMEYNHFDFEVLYMSRTEPDRSWRISDTNLNYKFTVFNGIHKTVKGYFIHWNWSLIKYAMKTKDSTIICGGSWNDLNIMAICVLKRLSFIKSKIIFWSEANYLTIGASKKNVLRDHLRSFIYNTSIENIIVPGEMSIKTFEHWNLSFNNFILLPNVIEEEAYCNKFSRYTNTSNLPKFIMPARLQEKIKGIVNFFKAIGDINIRKAVFYVCGDGPDKDMIQSFINENDLNDHIILKGWCSAEQMKEIYKESDAFVLPSYSDPSPLSIIEAMFTNLPLLLSERCGNHYEALSIGVNGYLFNPLDNNSIKHSYEQLLDRKDEWISMGQISKKKYENNFAVGIVIERFISELMCIENANK